jgi:hypothetical protein
LTNLVESANLCPEPEEYLSEAWEAAAMAEWVKPHFGKGDIDRAGARLVPWWKMEIEPDRAELLESYRIVETWRTSHAMPLLTFRMSLGGRSRRVDPTAIVAQRLKRFSSVMNKLVREPRMKLSQMQDLGGCRAIVSNVTAVEKLYELYRGAADLFPSHSAMKCYDYIKNPKSDGYRGVHVVGRYSTRLPTNEPWNGQRIEIQLRSRLQHAFATAVETVTTFTKEPLKFGAGPQEWRRFFALMGSALAARESTALVPGTPLIRSELVRELRELTKQLKVRQRLPGWTKALKELPKRNTTGAKWQWLLLVLDVSANTIKVTGYADGKAAAEAVASIEEKTRVGTLDAVVVRVRNIQDLRRAYPNYYADTAEFLKALDAALRL